MMEVMIDLETLGVRNSAIILSIGAVKFDPFTNELDEEFHVRLNLDDQEKAGRYAESSTVVWWMQQSEQARQNLLNMNPIHVISALGMLSTFCAKTNGVWGNGTMFDNALVLSLAESFGHPRPWSYKLDRCFRTFKNVFFNVQEPERQGVFHDALDDAKHQARWLQKIYAERLS